MLQTYAFLPKDAISLAFFMYWYLWLHRLRGFFHGKKTNKVEKKPIKWEKRGVESFRADGCFCGARGKMRGARRKSREHRRFSCVAWGEAGARGKVVWVASQASCEEAGIRTPRLSRPHGRRTMGCIGVGVRRLCQFCAPIADILL